MGSLRGFYASAVGKKVVMGVTGLIGIGFVILHSLGNLLVFRGPDAINSYSHFLKSSGELLWTLRIVLIVAVTLHVVAQLTHCRGGCASGQSRAHNDDGVFALVCWVYQLHLEAMAIPFLRQWPAGNARVELNTHRTIPANTATGTAVNAAHTRIAMTSEILRCSGWGDGGLIPMLRTELHAP